MHTILSFQSHVCYGYAGNSAATFIFQRYFLEPVIVHTVYFTNHTGYGKAFGRIIPHEDVNVILNGLWEMGFWQNISAIVSGYVGSETNGNALLEMIEKSTQCSLEIPIFIDPVMGDIGRGIFVKDDVVNFFRKNALKYADVITPNQFEAELLSEMKIRNIEDAKKVAMCLYKRMKGKNNGKLIIIKSILHDVGHELSNLMFDGSEYFLITTKSYDFAMHDMRIPGGFGDVFMALFSSNHIVTKDPISAFENATNIIFMITENTFKKKRKELDVINCQEEIGILQRCNRFLAKKI
ncbi:pyridoxal kinase [Candidatus Fokinia crypta]|uniref:pyridoxal kinase n=1 Tax=Candidatus Fokinia crypta TaxID=1920990 RepID=A0ABZ0UQN1_9RICK|nr:pyridoxal kinase [Candidatus Fokinia cryptica]WPX97531.1 Pyridoxamine kinase [Candidatus Fokinia cryptica]